MCNFRENEHPRNPKGEFQNKPGANDSSEVSLAGDPTMRRMSDAIRDIRDRVPRDTEVVELDGGHAIYRVDRRGSGVMINCGVFDDRYKKECVYRRSANPNYAPYYTLEVGGNYFIESSRDLHDPDYEQEYIGFGQGQSLTRARGVESLNGNTGYQYRFPSENDRPGPTLTTSTEPGVYVLVTSNGRNGDTYENLTQGEVDERYGPNFPLHSESNIDQVFDDNAAFLRGENDFYHEGYGL